MLYVGLDIHAKQITICVLDGHCQVHSRGQVRQVDQLMNFLEKLPKPFEVCFEASTGYGRYFEMLSPVASRVVVAHPGLLRLIYRSKKKNDRHDALQLAKLLCVGQVPLVHVPSGDVRSWRELINFRRSLIEKRAAAKNAIRGLLRSLGVQVPERPGLWTRKGLAWLKKHDFANAMHALKRDVLVDEIEGLSQQLRRVEQGLSQYAANSSAVQLLQTIPGVGPRTAEAVAAFIDDPQRFPDSKRLGSYFGLVPSQDQSGDRNRMGHITRQGSATVRHLLTEAVWQAARRSPTVKAYLERVQRGDKERRKIAIVATAHYLVRVMWAMLRTQKPWEERAAA